MKTKSGPKEFDVKCDRCGRILSITYDDLKPEVIKPDWEIGTVTYWLECFCKYNILVVPPKFDQ